MHVLILGVDGYIGFALVQHLLNKGWRVTGVDNFLRRVLVEGSGKKSVTPIADPKERWSALRRRYGNFDFQSFDICDAARLKAFLRTLKPDAIVNLAQVPSAPYSMMNFEACKITHINNTLGTLALLWALREHPVPIVQIGTLGEYGTPDIPIPDGYAEFKSRGRSARLPFPKQPGSFYHASKCSSSIYLEFACKCWDLSITDIMQGVVFGLLTDEIDGKRTELLTRFDVDDVFGTVINRFCAEAVAGYPLTVYGEGGQVRGFLPLRDSVRCISLLLENPPPRGTYRTVNQFVETYSVSELAQTVAEVAGNCGIDVIIRRVQNPRLEKERHFYQPECKTLKKLGFKPSISLRDEIENTIKVIKQFKRRVDASCFAPSVTWR